MEIVELIARRPSLLMEPTYGWVGPAPFRPSTRQILVEWVDAIAFWKDATRLLPALYAGFHLMTLVVFVYFLVTHFSLKNVLAVATIGTAIGTLYNTVWYHRYCSHRAYKFRSLWFARAFLWTNPICFREESYVIPHRVHHAKADQPGDPYGPHLGWLGSYLATESQQKINRSISRQDYARLAKSLEHVGFLAHSYEQFQRTGSVENLWHYGIRFVCINALWLTLGGLVAGVEGMLAWMAGVFLFTFVVRDFNFRGHSSLLGGSRAGVAVNQFAYGLIAGEWHGNHHEHPRLARSGFEWWQIDLPYWCIRGMNRIGMVTHCHKTSPRKHYVRVPGPGGEEQTRKAA